MSDTKKEQNQIRERKSSPNAKLTIPFFLVLASLTVAAFLIPLRPTTSYSEKRELAKFPEFSMETLFSGDYFDDISLWFSDTFPGREGWMTVSRATKALHGYSEISFVEDNFMEQIVAPVEPEEETSLESASTVTSVPAASSAVEETTAYETSPQETEDIETVPEETQWGGVEIGEDAEISMGGVIQIDDTAFNQLGFSEKASLRYASAISDLADALTQKGVTVVSAPPPTSVGVMIEPEYQEMLNCARQDEMLYFIHDHMSDNVVKVDTYQALVAHNSEYIYFRTDHHWTALGAYYAYTTICETLGIEPASLSDFEEVDNGEFRGTLTGKARYSHKLRSDVVYSYVPQGNISVYNLYDYGKVDAQLLQDVSNHDESGKYMTFLGGDFPLQEIINESLPEGSTCLIVKDSFGNCFAPFMTQNYHTVYVMDYRNFRRMMIPEFVDAYGVDTVIVMPYLMATQSFDAAAMFERICH